MFLIKSPILYLPSNNMHFFADVPHFLKLIRNNLLDHGIRIGDKLVDSSSLFELINHHAGKLNIVHKVNINHLSVRNNDRQKVSTAAQLLSNSVFDGLTYLGTVKNCLNSNTWRDTANFIKLINDWFDLLKSCIMSDAFSNSSQQQELLQKVIEEFQTASVNRKKYNFVTGVIMSPLLICSKISNFSTVLNI